MQVSRLFGGLRSLISSSEVDKTSNEALVSSPRDSAKPDGVASDPMHSNPDAQLQVPGPSVAERGHSESREKEGSGEGERTSQERLRKETDPQEKPRTAPAETEKGMTGSDSRATATTYAAAVRGAQGFAHHKHGPSDTVTNKSPSFPSSHNYHNKIRELDGRLRRSHDREQNPMYENSQLRHGISTLRSRIGALEDSKRRLEKDLAILHTEKAANDDELTRMKQLLESRAAELTAAQKFLATADEVAGGDVVRMIETLNSEVYQTAASIADALQSSERMVARQQDDVRFSYLKAECERILGSKMVELLLGCRQSKDDCDILLQSAIHSSLVFCCDYVIGLWSWNEGLNMSLLQLYSRISATEIHTVAARWRAMTLAQTKFDRAQEPEILGVVVRTISCVCSVAGRSSTHDESFIYNTFRDKLTAVSRQIAQLDRIIRLGVISRDLSIVVPTPGQPFVAAEMLRAFKHREAKDGMLSSSNILCTTDMGLVGTYCHAGGQTESVLHLKPKVMLDSDLT